MRLFISQPMKDRTNEEIQTERNAIIAEMEKTYDGIEVIDSFFKDAPHDAKPLWFLGKSFELLSTADIVYFAKDWDKYRGCCMEHEAAVRYEIGIIHHFDDELQ